MGAQAEIDAWNSQCKQCGVCCYLPRTKKHCPFLTWIDEGGDRLLAFCTKWPNPYGLMIDEYERDGEMFCSTCAPALKMANVSEDCPYRPYLKEGKEAPELIRILHEAIHIATQNPFEEFKP